MQILPHVYNPFFRFGSTDNGNVENELLIIVWCDHNGRGERVHTKIRHFMVDKFSVIDSIVQHFKFPLEEAGVDTFATKAKFEAIVSCAGSSISLLPLDHQSAWWWLFDSPTRQNGPISWLLLHLSFLPQFLVLKHNENFHR